MKTYARLQGGMVAELFSTAADIATLFPPSMAWVDVTATPQAQVGWQLRNGVAAAPPVPQAAPAQTTPPTLPASIAMVQAQLTALQAQVTQLAAQAAGAHA